MGIVRSLPTDPPTQPVVVLTRDGSSHAKTGVVCCSASARLAAYSPSLVIPGCCSSLAGVYHETEQAVSVFPLNEATALNTPKRLWIFSANTACCLELMFRWTVCSSSTQRKFGRVLQHLYSKQCVVS